ncbi:VanZ family protein [Halocatena halophila]|uniref:hypothetical protein n=1 Tax=Halocatena halophila TaxID=2814576 RepID=UPI002ED6ACD6
MPSIQLRLLSDRTRYAMVAVVAVLILVFSLSHTPVPMEDQTEFCRQPGVICLTEGPFGLVDADKWVHGFSYAGLTAVLAYAVVAPAEPPIRRRLGWVGIVAVSYGLLIELLQWPTARELDPFDGLANTVGVLIVATLWWLTRSHVGFESK